MSGSCLGNVCCASSHMDPNCLSCGSSGECTSCNAGKPLGVLCSILNVGSSCTASSECASSNCSPDDICCPENCVSCAEPSGTCSKCGSGYVLSDSTCKFLAGASCTSNEQCVSGLCSNGACAATFADGDEFRVTTLAGGLVSPGLDGTGTLAGFDSPFGIAMNASGTMALVVRSGHDIVKLAWSCVSPFSAFPFSQADRKDHAVRRIDIPSGVVTTITGSRGNSGYADGAFTTAKFSYLWGIAMNAAGTVALVVRSWKQSILYIFYCTCIVLVTQSACSTQLRSPTSLRPFAASTSPPVWLRLSRATQQAQASLTASARMRGSTELAALRWTLGGLWLSL